jgi:hypothetical protein
MASNYMSIGPTTTRASAQQLVIFVTMTIFLIVLSAVVGVSFIDDLLESPVGRGFWLSSGSAGPQ